MAWLTNEDDIILRGRLGNDVFSFLRDKSNFVYLTDHHYLFSNVKKEAKGWALSDYSPFVLHICKFFENSLYVIAENMRLFKKFPRVHRIFSNLKANIRGIHRFISVKHMQNYLNEFTFRFNRRRNIEKAFNDLLEIALSIPARTFEEFTEPEKVYYINPGG